MSIPHTDARRLVLGAVVGLRVQAARVFVESLRDTGYTGDTVLLTGLADVRLTAYLRRHGIAPRRSFFVRRLHGPIHAYRYELFAKYLRAQSGRYDEILLTDVRDVAFQAHPFANVERRVCHFFLEGAAKSIGEEPTNAFYMRLFLTPEQVARIASQRISCCGVVLGGTGPVTTYVERMAARLRTVPLRIRRKIGADTAFHNLIVHLTHDVPARIVENNLHVATMGIEPASRYVVGSDGRIRTTEGHLPPILHQYDRIAEVRVPVEQRFVR